MRGHDRFKEMLARRPELSSSEETRLQGHLEGCPQCRQLAADYARQMTLLRSLPPLQPPASLRQNVLRRIHQPPSAVRRRLLNPFLFLVPAAAVVAAIAIAFAYQAVRPPEHTAQSHLSHPSGASHPPSTTAPASPPPTVQPPQRSGTVNATGRPAHSQRARPHPPSRPLAVATTPANLLPGEAPPSVIAIRLLPTTTPAASTPSPFEATPDPGTKSQPLPRSTRRSRIAAAARSTPTPLPLPPGVALAPITTGAPPAQPQPVHPPPAHTPPGVSAPVQPTPTPAAVPSPAAAPTPAAVATPAPVVSSPAPVVRTTPVPAVSTPVPVAGSPAPVAQPTPPAVSYRPVRPSPTPTPSPTPAP